jgi:hypothetical protein
MPKNERTAQEMEKAEQQERQYNEEQDEQDIEAMDIAVKEGLQAAEEKAQELRQAEISEGMDVDMEAPGAPASPAGSEK